MLSSSGKCGATVVRRLFAHSFLGLPAARTQASVAGRTLPGKKLGGATCLNRWFYTFFRTTTAGALKVGQYTHVDLTATTPLDSNPLKRKSAECAECVGGTVLESRLDACALVC